MKTVNLLGGVVMVATIGMAHAAAPAQESAHGQHRMEAQPASQMKYAGHGVLKAVKANKVQIAHEPMPELQWPAMTMWFGLRDALPQAIRVGDRVRFEMMQAETRQWRIVRIERQ